MNFARGAVNRRESEGQIIDVVFDWGRVSSFQYGISLRRELLNQNTKVSDSVNTKSCYHLHKFGFATLLTFLKA